LLPILESPVQERQGTVGAAPGKVHKNDQKARTPFLRGKAERVGVVQPGEEKVLERSYCGLAKLQGGL